MFSLSSTVVRGIYYKVMEKLKGEEGDNVTLVILLLLKTITHTITLSRSFINSHSLFGIVYNTLCTHTKMCSVLRTLKENYEIYLGKVIVLSK